jgi:hypothetical protein
MGKNDQRYQPKTWVYNFHKTQRSFQLKLGLVVCKDLVSLPIVFLPFVMSLSFTIYFLHFLHFLSMCHQIHASLQAPCYKCQIKFFSGNRSSVAKKQGGSKVVPFYLQV